MGAAERGRAAVNSGGCHVGGGRARHHLAAIYPQICMFNTPRFQKGPSIILDKVLIYILNRLPGLPLRVAIVISIYIQLRNGSGCS